MTKPHLKQVTIWRASARGTTHGYGPTPALAMEHHDKGRAVRASVSAWSNRVSHAEVQLQNYELVFSQMLKDEKGLRSQIQRLQMAYDTLRAEWDKRYLDQPPKGTIR